MLHMKAKDMNIPLKDQISRNRLPDIPGEMIFDSFSL